MSIPLVGQPMEILTWYPTTLLRCNCKEEVGERPILIVTGIGGASMCPLCGSVATVQGILPNGQVDIIVRTKDPIGRVQ